VEWLKVYALSSNHSTTVIIIIISSWKLLKQLYISLGWVLLLGFSFINSALISTAYPIKIYHRYLELLFEWNFHFNNQPVSIASNKNDSFYLMYMKISEWHNDMWFWCLISCTWTGNVSFRGIE
jgi:hypothetical protein